MIRIRKIAHGSYEVPDPQQQAEYYTDILGLTLIAKDGNTIYLANTIDHHSIVLYRGAAPRCVRIGFQIGPDDDLDAFERQTAAHGIKTTRKSDAAPTISDMLTFEDLKGTLIEVFTRPEPRPTDFQRNGIVPNKLGHIAFHVTDAEAATKFYCDILGFRVSDWIADFFSFLRCGTDHHTINFLKTGSERHFHTAFELRDWSHLQRSCDFLSLNGYKLLWGPGRHGPGHNLFAYHRSPAGLITELFAELDQMQDEKLGHFEPRPWHRDHPQRPKVWPRDPASSNVWGPPRPDEMMQ
jgi:catechol 2,3-dioxygenase-like lactoylglutathione lyase family enzyme